MPRRNERRNWPPPGKAGRGLRDPITRRERSRALPRQRRRIPSESSEQRRGGAEGRALPSAGEVCGLTPRALALGCIIAGLRKRRAAASRGVYGRTCITL